MSDRTLKENITALAVKKALGYLDEDPTTSIPKLLAWADKFDTTDKFLAHRNGIRKVVEDPDNNWWKLIRSFWTDIDPEVRKVFFENFIINSALIGMPRQAKVMEKENYHSKMAVSIWSSTDTTILMLMKSTEF